MWGSTISLGDGADCQGRGAGCLGISTLCLGTTCLRGNSTISLRVSAIATCLCVAALSPWEMVLTAQGRGAGCLDISALCLGTTCLRGAGCLGTSILWMGVTCLKGNSAISLRFSADCLGTNCLVGEQLCLLGRQYGLPGAYMFGGKKCWVPEQCSLPGTTCLGEEVLAT